MKANELRIGNYVDNGFEDLIEVSSISEDSCSGYNIETLKPIPLTQEWLEKLGFGYWDDYEVWYSPDEDATLRIEHYTKGEKIGFYENDYGVHIKSVHSLQNLVFALTNTELKLKESDPYVDNPIDWQSTDHNKRFFDPK